MNPSEPIDPRFDYKRRYAIDEGELIQSGPYRIKPETAWGRAMLGTSWTLDSDGGVVHSFKTLDEAIDEMNILNNRL